MSAVLAFAQGGPGRREGGSPPDPQQRVQRRVEGLSRFLTLTDAQKSQATSIFTVAETQTETLRTSLRATTQSISEAVKRNDTSAIDQLSATAGTLTGQLMAAEGKANA